MERDGNHLTWKQQKATPKMETPAAAEPPARKPQETTTPPISAPPGGRGGVQFSVNVNVSMDEVARWSPERISAFFGGLAQVLAAQKGEDGK